MLPSRNISKYYNRALIAETGAIPAGMQLLRDTFSFKPLKTENTVTEAFGKEQPVMKITGLFQEGDSENANGRIYPTKSVLAPAVRAIQEDIGMRGVLGEFDHPCSCTDDFRVLTTNGWKEFRDIKIGDYVWSRVNGKMVSSRVNSIVNEPYDGTAYRINGRNINIEFTPGHRILFEKRPDQNNYSQIYATVEDVYKHRKSYSHSRVPTTAMWDGNDKSIYSIPGLNIDEVQKTSKHSDSHDFTQDLVFDTKSFVSFLGIYLSEGNLHSQNGICINQTNQIGRELVKQLLDRLHPDLKWNESKSGFYTNDARLAKYLRPLGNKYSKYIPYDIKQLASKYLEQLVYWFAIGDGRMLSADEKNKPFLSCKSEINGGVAIENCLDLGKYSRISVFTVSKKLISDLHECVVKTGRCGRLSAIAPTNDYVFADRIIKAANKKILYQLYISRNIGFTLDSRFTTIDQFIHTGNIYCLSVDHGNFYMEHKGRSFWTGNSDARIHLDRCSHLVTSIWMEGNRVYGQAEVLHKLPCGAYLRGLFEHKCRVGISSRGVGDMEVVESRGKETYRVKDGFMFVTWDCVAEPSVDRAYLNIQEGLNKKLTPIKLQRTKFSPEIYQNKLVDEINKYFEIK